MFFTSAASMTACDAFAAGSRGMNLIQIRYFLALAESLNFTRAASACNVTQPALTKSIRKLEEELGGPLVRRERNNSQLTELGAAMMPLLQQTFEAATAARRGATQFHQQDRTALRIGLGPWVPPGAIAPLLQELNRGFPKLEITVREGMTTALNDWLIGSDIDVAFTTDVHGLTARANAWSLFQETVVVLLHPTHPLADASPLPLDLLRSQVFVARSVPAGGSGAPSDLITFASTTEIRHLGDTEEQVWALVMAGWGVALSTGRRSIPSEIIQRPLDPPHLLNVHVATLPGRRPNQAVGAVLRLARSRDWSIAAG